MINICNCSVVPLLGVLILSHFNSSDLFIWKFQVLSTEQIFEKKREFFHIYKLFNQIINCWWLWMIIRRDPIFFIEFVLFIQIITLKEVSPNYYISFLERNASVYSHRFWKYFSFVNKTDSIENWITLTDCSLNIHYCLSLFESEISTTCGLVWIKK